MSDIHLTGDQMAQQLPAAVEISAVYSSVNAVPVSQSRGNTHALPAPAPNTTTSFPHLAARCEFSHIISVFTNSGRLRFWIGALARFGMFAVSAVGAAGGGLLSMDHERG